MLFGKNIFGGIVKNYFVTRIEDIYRFYILSKISKKKVKRRRSKKKKNDLEISYELLLEQLKNIK